MKTVIIGSGHASITAVNTLIQNDNIDLTIITEDRFPYYPRPSVYKEFGGKKPEKIISHSNQLYSDKGISLM